MDQIEQVDAEAQTVRVQPGCRLGDLNAALADDHLKFAPDPAWGDRSVVGRVHPVEHSWVTDRPPGRRPRIRPSYSPKPSSEWLWSPSLTERHQRLAPVGRPAGFRVVAGGPPRGRHLDTNTIIKQRPGEC